MFDDINAFVSEMEKRDVRCRPVQDEGWACCHT
jgi:hypothetical protein